MPKYTITNRSNSTIVLPVSPSVKIGPHGQETIVADAHDMSEPAMVGMVNAGLVTVSVSNDPDTPDVLEGATVGTTLLGRGNPSLHGENRTLYVAATGSDLRGDGSKGNPFATPQRAFDEVPDGYGKYLGIKVGVGTFDAPTLRASLGVNGYVFLSGSLSSEYLDVSSVVKEDFSPVAGKAITYEAACPAHSGIDSFTHFLGQEGEFYDSASILLPTGAGSTLRVSDYQQPYSFNYAKVCVYTTFFTQAFGPAAGSCEPGNMNQCFIYGVKFVSTGTLENCGTRGCSSSVNRNFKNCNASMAIDGNFYSVSGSSFTALDKGYVTGDVYGDGDMNVSGVIGGNIKTGEWNHSTDLALGNVDLDAGASIIAKKSSNVRIAGNMSTTAANTSFITATEGARITRTGGVLLTVALQGRLLTLNEGASATGMEVFLAGSTNAAAAGEEVKVGAAAAQTSASLPATDAAELCRAT